MSYLLDTCIITDFIKNDRTTVNKIKSLLPSDLYISVITTAEIEYGIQKIKGTQKANEIIKITKSLIDPITEIDIDHQIALEAGIMRADLVKIGKITGAHDILIAATAKVKNLIMVTNNTKDFEKIEGLQLQKWKENL